MLGQNIYKLGPQSETGAYFRDLDTKWAVPQKGKGDLFLTSEILGPALQLKGVIIQI